MPDFNDIPTGLRVPSQIPLDIKEYFATLADLQNLGSSNNKAFTYYKGFRAYCVETDKIYIWKEALPELGAGVLPSNFTYPDGTICYGVDYSEKEYNFFVKAETLEIISIGSGIPIYKGYNSILNRHEIMSAVSNTILISQNGSEISFELPSGSRGIPSLIANQDYAPIYNDFLNYYTNIYLPNGGTPLNVGEVFYYKGEGSSAKPFTDTRIFTFGEPLTLPTILPNISIDNLLEAYVGTGTRFSPENSGKKLLIDTSITHYNFSNDFNYSNLDLDINSNVNCTTTGWLLDMDNNLNFNEESSGWKITIKENYILDINSSLGFRNSGNTENTPPLYTSGRIACIYGEGTLYCSYNGPDVLTRYIFNGEGNNNDGGLHFNVKCRVNSNYQGIYFSKNFNRIDFYNQIQSGVYLGSINIALKAFHMTGGQIRFFEKAAISFNGEQTGRTYGLTFAPEDDGIGYCHAILNGTIIKGTANYMFAKLNNENVYLYCYDSQSGYGFSTTIPGTITLVNGLFENLGEDIWAVDFKNNVFPYTGIDFTKVDLTLGNSTSSINYIANQIVECLVRHPYRRDGGSNTTGNLFLPKYSKFINMNGSMIESEWYVDIML